MRVSLYEIQLLITSVILLSSHAKVLLITQKTLPNVLRQLSKCRYSVNYKQKFVNYYNNPTIGAEHTVGIVDCLTVKSFCEMQEVTYYPVLQKIYQNQTFTVLQAELFLGSLIEEHKTSDEYLASLISQKLRSKPHFIVALFEEQGMPVEAQQKIRGIQYQDRVFYLSEGRVANTLNGFTNNKTGCWIFMLRSEQTGAIANQYCGSTYQSPTLLAKTINKFVNQISINKRMDSVDSFPQNIFDSSNHQSEEVMGYSKLTHWLKDCKNKLEVSGKPKASMCTYLYIWSSKCKHCDYHNDMKVIGHTINKRYKQQRQTDVNLLHKLYSYDISNNRNIILGESEIASLTGLSDDRITNMINPNQQIYLIPDLISLCFSTSNNRELSDNLNIEIQTMTKIIALQNIDRFVKNAIQCQLKRVNRQHYTKQNAEEL